MATSVTKQEANDGKEEQKMTKYLAGRFQNGMCCRMQNFRFLFNKN